MNYTSSLAVLAAILGIPALLLGGVQAFRKLRISRLNRPQAFELPPIHGATAIFVDDIPDLSIQLAGRDVDVHQTIKLISQAQLTIIRGESGVGKSTFLKLGLARALYSQGWLPIYVDDWPLDWKAGPQVATVPIPIA